MRTTWRRCVALGALWPVGIASCVSDGADALPDDVTALLFAQTSGTTSLLQAVSPVSDRIVWVSGHGGTWLRSENGGSRWELGTVPGAEELQFRDVAAFDRDTAYLMSSGDGDLSRIYRTDDGGDTWRLQYRGSHPGTFLDCMDFWSPERGLVYGDEIDGVPFILRTEDGGDRWERIAGAVLPAALEAEGGFAASGTCVDVGPDGWAWIATGNGARSRVLYTADYGATWAGVDAPVAGGSAAGLTTIQVEVGGRGVAFGGLIGNDTARVDNAARTEDGGRSWRASAPLVMSGPVYGSATLPERDVVVAVGPRGMNISTDFGDTWASLSPTTFWAVAFGSGTTGWAVGPQGRIVRITVEPAG